MNLPIEISFFYCYCGNEWRIFRNDRQYSSTCQKCGEKNRVIEFRRVYSDNTNIKCYGHFTCFKCDNSWTSAHTWILYKQKCFKCKTKCYPDALKEFYNNELMGEEGDGKRKFHKMESCTKCWEVGDCRKFKGEYGSERKYRNKKYRKFVKDDYPDYD